MRLFIAINFDDATKDKLQEVQDRMKLVSKGNYTKRDNLHLTLAFLGEIDEKRIPEIKAAMDKVSVPKMKLTFSEIGCFRRDSELWWIGLKRNKDLEKCQSQLNDELLKNGFKVESRRFIPHITLARQTRISKESSKQFLKKDFETTVSKMCLMLSERVDGKLVYSEIF